MPDDDNHQEESKVSRIEIKPAAALSKVEERKRLDDNVKAYDKKLSDFERMFLFINEELDFK